MSAEDSMIDELTSKGLDEARQLGFFVQDTNDVRPDVVERISVLARSAAKDACENAAMHFDSKLSDSITHWMRLRMIQSRQ